MRWMADQMSNQRFAFDTVVNAVAAVGLNNVADLNAPGNAGHLATVWAALRAA